MKLAIEPQEHTNTRDPTMLQPVITLNRSCVLVAAIVGLVISLNGETRGDMIIVANSSFEGPTYASGDFGSEVTGWVLSGTGGAFRPALPSTVVNNVPDGNQLGFAGNTGGSGALFQDLGVSVIAGATYNLDVFVGSRNDSDALNYRANYLVELIAGSTTFASQSGTLLRSGNFIPINVTAQGAGSGNLAIRLSETNDGQSLFDNVRLSVTAVPEPSSLFMLSTGALGLVGYGWRRRRST
jgi:hypothetical protein